MTCRNLVPNRPAIGWPKVSKPCDWLAEFIYLPPTNSRPAWYKVSTYGKALLTCFSPQHIKIQWCQIGRMGKLNYDHFVSDELSRKYCTCYLMDRQMAWYWTMLVLLSLWLHYFGAQQSFKTCTFSTLCTRISSARHNICNNCLAFQKLFRIYHYLRPAWSPSFSWTFSIYIVPPDVFFYFSHNASNFWSTWCMILKQHFN